MAGGLFAETYAGRLFLHPHWLDARLRRGGLGRGVIALAEAEAMQHGCHPTQVDTSSFQTPGFYREQAYVEFGRPPHPPRGERLFPRKSLAP